MRRIATALACLGLLTLGACANQNSIYRNNSVASDLRPSLVTTDAKQRHVLAVPKLNYTSKGTIYSEGWRLCAEASPDVFSALSTAISGEAALGVSDEQRLQAAVSIAEAAGTVERTQTINLLRESMYRTCERYLNDAIGRSELTVQAARDQRMMVAVLAIEQLTRSVWPDTTVISAGQASASVKNAEAYYDRLSKAARAEATTRSAHDASKTNYDKIVEGCKDVPVAATDEDAAITQRRKDCSTKTSAAKVDMDKAAGDYAAAQAELAALQKVAPTEAGGGLTTAAGSGGATTTVAVTAQTPVGDVASAVKDIVKASLEFDELEMLCVRALLEKEEISAAARKNEQLQASCVSLIAAKARVEAADEWRIVEERKEMARTLVVLETDGLAAIRQALEKAKPADVSAWWGGVVDKANLPIVDIAKVKAARTPQEIENIYKSLHADYKKLIISALN